MPSKITVGTYVRAKSGLETLFLILRNTRITKKSTCLDCNHKLHSNFVIVLLMLKIGIKKHQSPSCMLLWKGCYKYVIMMLFQCISTYLSSIRQTCYCDVQPMLIKRNSIIMDSSPSGERDYSACYKGSH